MRHFLTLIGLVVMLAHVLVGETIQFTDKLGRTTRLEVPVNRAVIYHLFEYLPPLDCWDRIAGLSRYAHKSELMLAAKPDIASTIPSAGSGADINMETLLNLRPDVVLTWTYRPEMVRFLEQKGIKVIAIYPDSIREMFDIVALEGRLFGRQKEAESVIRQMNRIFGLIRQRAAKIPPQNKAKVLWTYSRQNSVGAGASLPEELISMIGAVNVAGAMHQRTAEISIESILGWNPDVVFVWGNANYQAEEILNSTQWRSIKAVRDKKVFKTPEWSTWSPCLAVVALWMAVKTYPELYRDIDFHAVADRFFQDVFGFPILETGRNDF